MNGGLDLKIESHPPPLLHSKRVASVASKEEFSVFNLNYAKSKHFPRVSETGTGADTLVILVFHSCE